MKLSRVTVTGADDSIQPLDLVRLTEKYDFVEWAILVSANSSGKPRYPSDAWLAGLSEVQKTFNLPLAAHVCGRWLRGLLLGNPGYFEERKNDLWMYKRFQLNFHAERLPMKSDLFAEALRPLSQLGEFIFQQDGVNNDLINIGHFAGLKCSALFDLSGGAGLLPTEWPTPIVDTECGYAGGLSPDNVAEQMGILETIVGDETIWIDAETRLRSDDDSLLDLEKVEAYLEAAKPWAA